MNNLSGKDFLKTLKCVDIETETITGESLDWLFDKKETSDILTWLCTYVNENNIETCNEIQEYNALKSKGQNLTEEYIDNLCKSNAVLEDVYNVTEFEVNFLKNEIEHAKIKSDNLQNLTSKYLFLEGKLNRNIEDEEMNSRIKRTSYLTKCTDIGKQVNDFHNNFYEKIEKFSDILSSYNVVREKYFISQMPLHSYGQQCDIFQTNLHLWIRKNFEKSNLNYSNGDIENIDKELNRLYFTIRQSIVNHVQSDCNQKELAAKLSYFRNNTSTEIPEEQKNVQLIQYTSRINILYNDIESLYANELQQETEKFTENLINTVLIRNLENKLSKCTDILKTLKNLNNEIIQAVAQYQLLILLLKTDKNKLRDIDKFLEDLYFYSSHHLKNYTIRSQLMNEAENNVTRKELIFKEIIAILTEKYSDAPIDIRSAIIEIEKQKVAIENLENELFVIRNKKYLHEVKQVEQNIVKSKKLIWCGPTLQPVITPYEFLENLSITNCQIDNVKKMLKLSMDNLNQTRVIIKKNTWSTHRRLLWAWFLMKPEKIPALIEQLRDFVTEQARSNT